MSSTKKSGGGSLLKFAVIAGVGGYLGHKYLKSEEPKTTAVSPHIDTAPYAQSINAQQGPPISQCLDALGNCLVYQPCPLDQAKRYLRSKGSIRHADDAAHATLLEVCEKADQIPRQDWAKWLMWRASRRQIDYFRKDQRHVELDDEIPVSNDGMESDPLADRRLRAALSQLRTVDRCVIEGKIFDDRDNATVQRDCGLDSPNMVSKQLGEAVRRLKIEWDKSITATPGLRPADTSRFGRALPPGAAPPVPEYPARRRSRSANLYPGQDEGYAPPAPSYDPRQDDDD